MKKLSQEQAEWLIDELINKTNGLGRDFSVAKSEIKEIINQCTEKEFPDITIDTSKGGVFTVKKEENNIIFTMKPPDYCMELTSYYIKLPVDTFKRFTERCNKIVEYLYEQA